MCSILKYFVKTTHHVYLFYNFDFSLTHKCHNSEKMISRQLAKMHFTSLQDRIGEIVVQFNVQRSTKAQRWNVYRWNRHAQKKRAKILRRCQSSTPLTTDHAWIKASRTASFRAAYAMELPRRDCREASQWSRRGNSATSCRLRGRENSQAERVREEQNPGSARIHIVFSEKT